MPSEKLQTFNSRPVLDGTPSCLVSMPVCTSNLGYFVAN